MKNLLLLLTLLASLNASDLIYDNTTSALWQNTKENSHLTMTHKQAKDYCSRLTIEQYSDFRLPTVKELQTLVDFNKRKPAILSAFNHVASDVYWSSTIDVYRNDSVWAVDFKTGSVKSTGTTYDRHIRCVQTLAK